MNLIDLKERIAIGANLTPDERRFVLEAINAATERVVATAVVDVPNYLGRIEHLWVALSLDDGGEGLCTAPVNGITLPLMAADPTRLSWLKPTAQRIASIFNKPVRLAKFGSRRDVEIYTP